MFAARESLYNRLQQKLGSIKNQVSLLEEEINQSSLSVLTGYYTNDKSLLFAIVEGDVPWDKKTRLFHAVLHRVTALGGGDAARDLLLRQSLIQHHTYDDYSVGGNTVCHKLITALSRNEEQWLASTQCSDYRKNATAIYALINATVDIEPKLCDLPNAKGFTFRLADKERMAFGTVPHEKQPVMIYAPTTAGANGDPRQYSASTASYFEEENADLADWKYSILQDASLLMVPSQKIVCGSRRANTVARVVERKNIMQNQPSMG